MSFVTLGRRLRRALLTAAVAAVASGLGVPLVAQDATATLRGVVTDTAGTRVPYALVRLLPIGSERFTDERGAFAFPALRPGAYRIQARQVGFEPFDAPVTLPSDGASLRLTLRPLAVRLDELTVSAPGRCRAPAPVDRDAGTALGAIFAQLHENARRFVVLADSYPFQYFVERTFTDVRERGERRRAGQDTVQYESNARARYRPGDVIGWSTGPGGRQERVFRLASLPDLADSAFRANHCFGYAGVRERSGRRYLRVTFRAVDTLTSPDVDGEADLDPDSYQLRHLEIRLTRPGRAEPRLLSASLSITLTELHRNILIPGTVRASIFPAPVLGVVAETRERLEEQRLLGVRFVRPLPSDSTPGR